MSRFRPLYLWSFGIGLVYAAIGRCVFGLNQMVEGGYGLATAAFVFLLPVAIGAVTVAVGKRDAKWRWRNTLTAPLLVVLAALGGTIVLGIEAFFCVVMAGPVMLVMALIGAAVTHAVLGRLQRNGGKLFVAVVVLAPYLAAPIEHQRAVPRETVVADTQIAIAAPPATVWNHIIRVAAISPQELRDDPVYWIGLPRPIEATLSHEGIGGVRNASFERSVLFYETVTRWEPEKLLSFTIRAAGDFIPPATFDRNLTQGGRFFEVLSGTYKIEPVDARHVVLHLRSDHRVSTRFNWYTALWTDWIMSHIQESILRVVKARCEATTVAAR